MSKAIRWESVAFSKLTPSACHALFQLRAAVFVVEQNCVYLDPDDYDLNAHHLLGWQDAKLSACCRILPPKEKYDEASIGRVATAKSARGQGTGRALMERAIAETERLYPSAGIRISAQNYLRAFYESLGFTAVGAIYDEDGIPHVEMLRVGPR